MLLPAIAQISIYHLAENAGASLTEKYHLWSNITAAAFEWQTEIAGSSSLTAAFPKWSVQQQQGETEALTEYD